MKMKRWLILLCALLLVVPGLSRAEAADEDVILAEFTLPEEEDTGLDRDYAALHTAYANQVMGLSPTDVSRSYFDFLNDTERMLYNTAAAQIRSVAAGKTNNTKVEFLPADLGIGIVKVRPADIGRSTFRGADGKVDSSAVDEARTLLLKDVISKDRLKQLMWNLVYDMPLEYYWFGNKISYGYGSSVVAGVDREGEYICFNASKACVNMGFYPSAVYAQDGLSAGFMVDTSLTSAANNAAANAKAIVEEGRGLSDWNKLAYYAGRIRALCDYNYDALADDYSPVNQNGPWSLVWVFDGDPDTKVVCEGYAKAFKYLVDLSTFADRELECYTVAGTMWYEGGGGAHAWSILVCSTGQFLVDVTNCSETPSPGGCLFLCLPEEQSEDGATFNGITYVYDNARVSTLPDWLKTYCRHGDHATEEIPGYDPTCTETGLASILCTGCGKPLSPAEIPALGHEPVTGPGTQVKPTVTATGLTAGVECARCGEILKPQVVVPCLVTEDIFDLPAALTELGQMALADTDAQGCVIPKGVTRIGANALSGVTMVWLRCTDPQLDQDAFAGLDPEKTTFFAPAGSPLARWLVNNGYIVITE